MPYLELISLECAKTEDWTGPDEPYIVANGVKVWGPTSMNDGDKVDLSTVQWVKFTERVDVELWDQDTGGPDPNDMLGSFSHGPSLAEGSVNFTGDGADYTLFYRVREIF